jgi:Zn finger protein HypA/HybF involved in hydrogenase expression
MTTVSVAKREGLSPFFQRSFDDPKEAARFADSWRPMHVTIHDESGQALDPSDFIRCKGKPKESALRPFKDAEGADALCPFCGATETPILADDECLHACATCDRAWYIDDGGNALPADRCPTCESPEVSVDGDSDARTCGACGHAFFFDGLTYVNPATVATESDGAEC